MRNDQYQRLQSLSEKLTDVVLFEADPAKWPGDGIELAELTRDDRGDRYWCKKNAAATLSLLTKVSVLVNIIERQQQRVPIEEEDEGVDLDSEIRAAEKQSARILKRIQEESRARSN